MTKVALDLNWVKQMQKSSNTQASSNGDNPVVNVEGYGEYIFRLLPPSANNPGRFGVRESSHWVIGLDGNRKRITCVEETFPEKGLTCPICELIRELRKSGKVANEELDNMETYDNCYMKVLLLKAPGMECKPDHVTILRSNVYNMIWLTEQYMSGDTVDFLNVDNGVPIKFSRNKDAESKKWVREILPAEVSAGPLSSDPKIQESILKGNEAIDLTKWVKLPTDDQMAENKAIADKLRKQFNDAVATQQESIKEVMDQNKPVDETPAEGMDQIDAMVNAAETKSEPATSSKPMGSPECFGNKDIYDESSVKCLRCPFDYECGNAVKK